MKHNIRDSKGRFVKSLKDFNTFRDAEWGDNINLRLVDWKWVRFFLIALALFVFAVVTIGNAKASSTDNAVVLPAGSKCACECKVSPTPIPKPTKAVLPTTGSVTVKQIQAFLKKRNSPMVSDAIHFVEAGKKYGIDPRLMVAIATQESNVGKFMCAKYNPFGIKKKGKCVAYNSFKDVIYYEAWLLGEYKKGGKVTVEQIAKRYNPSGWEPWSKKVGIIMSQIK